MTLAISERQKEEINGQGFTLIKDVLDSQEVARVSTAMDEVTGKIRRLRGLGADESVTLRNSISRDERILALVDHPRILPLVVDIVGWNIHNRDSVFDYKAPLPPDADPEKMSLGWHFDYEEEFAGTTIDGCMPLLDFKVGWYISDHSEAGHSTILLVPGSFRWNREQRAPWESWLDPNEIFELRVPAGSALLWRPTLLHGVTPNLSGNFRKALYMSYSPRWIRPSGHLEQDPQLIARSTPIRRQLLGAMGNLSHPLGNDPEGSPSSQYWFTDDWDNVPLKAWAEERLNGQEPGWGVGFGATFTKGPGFEFTQVAVPKEK